MRTPYYIFNKKTFDSLLAEYCKRAEVYYPIKANDNCQIVKAVIEQNAAFEVDGIRHIQQLVNRYFVDPQRIIYSFPIKKENDIKIAKSLGIIKYVVDSFDEFNKVDKIVKNPHYIIRLNANAIVGGLSASQDKWGILPSEINDIIRQIKLRRGVLFAISFYLSSEINSVENFRKIFQYLQTINLGEFYAVDIGGGLKIDALNQLASDIDAIRRRTIGNKIIVEPGKDLLDPCFQMKVSIIAEKKSMDGKRILFIDAGIYHGLLDVIVKNKHFDIYDIKNGVKEQFFVCGCSSDVSDYIGNYELSNSLNIGDCLYINGCGAYSSVMTTNFYSQKRAGFKIIE